MGEPDLPRVVLCLRRMACHPFKKKCGGLLLSLGLRVMECSPVSAAEPATRGGRQWFHPHGLATSDRLGGVSKKRNSTALISRVLSKTGQDRISGSGLDSGSLKIRCPDVFGARHCGIQIAFGSLWHRHPKLHAEGKGRSGRHFQNYLSFRG